MSDMPERPPQIPEGSGSVGTRDGQILVRGVPSNWTREQKQQLIENIRSTIGGFQGSFTDLQNTFDRINAPVRNVQAARAPQPGAADAVETPLTNAQRGNLALEGMTPRGIELASTPPGGPPDTGAGALAQATGATARGVATAVPSIADTLLAGGAAVAQGLANIPLPAGIADVVNAIDRIAGREDTYGTEGIFRRRIEPVQPLQALQNVAGTLTPAQDAAQRFMDSLGYARSESEVAQGWENVVREVGVTAALGLAAKGLSALSAGQAVPASALSAGQAVPASALSAGQAVPASALSARQTLQRIATSYADAPVQAQVRAALAGELGNEATRWATRQIGEMAGLEPQQIQILENILGTAAGMGTEIGFEVGIPNLQRQQTINRLNSANMTPEMAQDIVARGAELDVPVRRSDVIPPDTASAIQAQRVRESMGFGQRALAEQTRASNAAIEGFLSEYGVSTGRPRTLADTQELADTFIAPRRADFERFGELKTQALAAVPEDQIIDTSNAISRIDAQIERLRRLGGANADVNIPASANLTEADVRTPNRYQPTISKLEQMRASLQNKTIDELEQIRVDFGEDFIPEGGYGRMKTRDREVVQDVYDGIRSDIGNAVQQYGGDPAFEDWQLANMALADLMEDYRTHVVKRFVQNVNAVGEADADWQDLPPEIFEQRQRTARMAIEANPEMLTDLFVSGSPSDIKAMLPYIGQEGRIQGVAAYLQDILEKSRVAGERSTIIDRGNFSDELRRSLERRDVIMEPVEMQMADGLQTLFDHVRGPGGVSKVELSSMLNDVPGARYGAARFFGSVQGLAMAGASLLTAGQLARIYESPRTRDYLLELASTPPRTPKADILVRQIINAVQSEEVQDALAAPIQEPGPNRQVR